MSTSQDQPQNASLQEDRFIAGAVAADQDTPGAAAVAELVWHDLHGRVPMAQVRAATGAIFARYRDARIQAFIPIIVRRQAREFLQDAARTHTDA